MQNRWISLLLLLSFLIGYLEWGGGHSGFIFQLEFEIVKTMMDGVHSVMHPLIIIPFIGQLVLLYNVFQKKPSGKLILIAILLLSLLGLLIFFIGMLTLNPKIILSTLPFISISIYYFLRKRLEQQRAIN